MEVTALPTTTAVHEPARAWVAPGAVTALIVAIARILVSRGRDEFSLWPDEPAQLAMSRFLGGGVPWTMHDHSTWQPGYATLLSPVHWFTDDPVAVFHAALALNAVLGGAAAALLVVLVRRLTTLTPWIGATVAAVISLAPAALFTTEFVWSEALVLVLFPATLLALLRFDDSPTMWRGVVAGILAALAFGTHSRMVPLAFVTIGVAALAVFQGRTTARIALGVVASTAVAMFAVRLYTGFVFERLWDTPSTTNSFGGVVDHLGAPGTILIALAGQAWYLLAATVGIVLYGALSLVRSARLTGTDADTQTPARRDAVLTLVVIGGCASTSVLFMAGRFRPDQIVYGRYNDAVITPVLIVGLAFLLTEPSIRGRITAAIAAVVALCGCAAVLVAWRDDPLESGNGLEPMILGLQPFIAGAPSIEVIRITLLAAVTTMVVSGVGVVARRFGVPLLVLGVTAVLVIVASASTADVVDDGWHGRGDLSRVGLLADTVLADGAAVEFLLPDGSSTDRLMLYQLYLPANRITVVEDLDDATSQLIFAPTDDPILTETATREWTDPRRKYALWRR